MKFSPTQILMNKIIVKSRADKRISNGHLWVFSNELKEIPKLEPGCIVDVFSENGKSHGYGFYNPNSLISVRMLNTYGEINSEFFEIRFIRALDKRKLLFPDENSFRLVFGESDWLPGLIVDKFEDYFSIQILSAGMENLRELIIQALLAVFPETKGILAKNNSTIRQAEGLPLYVETVFGTIPDSLMITENGIIFAVSLATGQKTGFFFDQKENRKLIQRICKGKTVLDCFTNQGGFALNAAKAGAASILGSDSSNEEIIRAKENANLNNFNNVDFVCADVFEFLESEIRHKNQWDVIILDPPAFAKSKKSVPSAKKGYARLNSLALTCLNDSGFLATSSCSHHIYEDTFYNIIISEAEKLGKSLNLVFRGLQSPDHPIMASMKETQYLKFFIFQNRL